MSNQIPIDPNTTTTLNTGSVAGSTLTVAANGVGFSPYSAHTHSIMPNRSFSFASEGHGLSFAIKMALNVWRFKTVI